VRWDGELTIVIGIVVNWIKTLMGDYGLHIVVGATVITCLLTILGTVFRVHWFQKRPKVKVLFNVPVIWLLIRLIGMSFGLMYLFQFGPAALLSEEIGGAFFVEIGINVIGVYVSACILLPLLTNFGFMEFAGTLARPVFRRAFHLPGRAAIDALTSFVGASSIGPFITIGQYDGGIYTQRQACEDLLWYLKRQNPTARRVPSWASRPLRSCQFQFSPLLRRRSARLNCAHGLCSIERLPNGCQANESHRKTYPHGLVPSHGQRDPVGDGHRQL
jgi:hypothetical protein